jgi:hypothetical protein
MGDANQDGFADFVVGSYGDDPDGASEAGTARVCSGKHCPAWSGNYGAGWSGTNGVPALFSSDVPVICSSISLILVNSRGIDTQAQLFVGLSAASLPTVFDGTLFVSPLFGISLSLSSAGLTLPAEVPCDTTLCDVKIFLQALEIDPGASKGISFTPGLKLVLGGENQS